MIRTLSAVLLALTTFTAAAQVIVESRVTGGGVSSNPPYAELAGTWLSSTLKSTAPGVTAGVGSRFSSSSNGFPAFVFKPTLIADKIYSVEVTHGSATSIPTNLLAAISVLGGSGLPPVTDVFARSNANAWEYVGDLTLDPGVSMPEITFTYASNQPPPNSTSRRFYADAVRFTEATIDPPQIVSQPSSRTNLAGTTATFSVSATGALPMLFAWRKDGVALVSSGAISGTATPSLTISNVSSGNIGSYDVVVTNSYGAAFSDAVTLTVTNAAAIPPSITNQPQSQAVVVGQTATFSVGAAGTGPLSYQWAKDGITLTNGGRISGVSSAFLVVSNVASGDAANYSVTVTNTAGTTNSNPAILTVNPAVPPSITNQPQSQTVIVGQTVTFSVGAAGTSPLSYQWAKDGVTLTNGSKISGASTAFLVVSNAALGDAANYTVTVSNSAGSTNSDVAVLTVNAVPPSITTQPQSQTVAVGQSTLFSVTVTGTSPFGYQWTFNGTNILGATGSTLTITNAQASNQGSYVVMVTNSVGSVTSVAATLTVAAPGSIVVVESMIGSNVLNSFPPYQEIASIWLTTTLKSSASGVTPGVGSRFATNGVPAFTIKPTLQAGGIYSIAVTHGSTTSIPSNLVVNITIAGGTGLPSTTTAFSSSGANTWVAIGTVTLDAGVTQPDITFSYSTNQAGASSTRRLYADAIRFVLTGNSQPTIVSQPTSQTNLVGAAVSFNVALTGSAPLLYQWRKDGNALFDSGTISGANTAALSISSISSDDAGSYDVSVTNSYGSVLSAAATLTVTNPPAIPPSITNQPQSQTVVMGQTAIFSVGAAGTSPLGYQWFKDGITLTNDGRISGVSTAFLVVSNATVSDAGNYTVTVSNSAGSTNSDLAVLTVAVPPAITTQPQSQTVTTGQNVAFTITVAGTSPFGYQWALNGTDLPGATGSTFTIANAQTNNQGSYVVTVTNSFGSATSAPATLTVTTPASTVIVESMVASNVVNSAPLYQEIASTWQTSPLKSSATGVTPGVGSRFSTNGTPAFKVKPTLQAGGTYTIAVTHALTSLIPSNLVANITVVGGTGLPSTTTAFASPGANTWVTIGTLFLDAGVTQPDITFSYATNQLQASSTRRFFADAIRFVPSTNLPPTDPPSIVTQPASQTKLAGTTVNFGVAVTGTAPLAYNWRKDGTPLTNTANITGASTATLTISSITSGDQGNYDVIITNSYGSILSAAAILAVTNAPPAIPPSITNQPQSQTILVGQRAIFSVGVTGTSPLSYQWFKDGITLTNGGRISGVTNASLVVSNAVSSDAANYSVAVANVAGTTNSDNAVLTVNSTPPSITAQPQSQIVTAGQSVLFSVTVAGTSPFGYQWAFNGTDMAGATRSSLTVTNAQANNQGDYVVTVTNAVGFVTSAPATLTVVAPGSIVVVESMVSSNVVTSSPLYQEVSSIWQSTLLKSSAAGVTPGVGSRFATNGVPAFTIKPTLQAGGIYSIAVTHGSTASIPSNLVVNVTITGGTGLPGTTTAFSSSGANAWVAIGTVTLDTGVTQPDITFSYATNQAGASSTRRLYADAIRFVLSTNSQPTIVSHPISQTNLVGAAVTFNVVAAGTGPLLYQWRKDGVALFDTGGISGANSAALSISSISSSDGGSYDVVVTNSYGMASSSPALLVVTNPAPPSITAQPLSQTIIAGGTAFFSITANGTAPLSYHWRKDGTVISDDATISGSSTAFLQVTNASSIHAGDYDVVVSNSAGAVTSDTAVLTVNFPPVITIQPSNQVVLEGQDANFFVSVSGTPPFGYQWSIDGVNIPGATNDTLAVSNVHTENQANYRVRVSSSVGTVFSSFATLNISAPGAVVVESKLSDGNITPAPEYQEFGSWFTSATKSSAPGLSGTGSRFLVSGSDPTFAIVPILPTPGGMYAVEVTHGWSPNIPNTNLLADISVVGGSGLPEVTDAFGAWGSNVWKRVGIITLDASVVQPEIRFTYSSNQPPSGFGRRFYADGIRLIEIPTPPVITVSPVDQEVVLGDNATFTVTATGTAPLSFQWIKDGIPLSGATDSTLNLIGVLASDAGSYTVGVSNCVGSVLSSEAGLIVHFPAAIIAPPVDREVIQGQSATFLVTAAGDLPLGYQWQFNGLNIAGATTAAITLNGVTAANAGSYAVIVTNSYGLASATASLVVDIPPTILVQPADVLVTAGQSFAFTVTAAGTEPFHYQWQFNGATIPGATGSSLSGVSDDFNGGYYSVVINNLAGSVTSAAAKLIKPIPAGLYNGLFYEADQVRHASSGLLHLELISSGSFTGKVSVAGSDYRFTGTFSDVHQANVSIPRTGTTPLTMSLRLLTTNQNDVAAGTISDGAWSANLLADRAFYSTNNPPPQTGEYTVALNGDSSGITSPGGSGVGLVTVKSDGTVSFHGGLLSDNTSVSQSVPLSRGGHWPVYVSLYAGQGSLLGWITFENRATNSFQGDLSWIKRGGMSNSYAAGFTNELAAVGSSYIYPPGTPGVLDLTNVTMTSSGSSLNADLDFSGVIPVLPSNKIESSSGANQLKLKIKENGRITGTLLWAPTGQLLPVNGVVLQQDRTARGFFTAPDKTTGSFLLRAP